MDKRASITAELEIGARIKINHTAGTHLANKQGVVVGFGMYRDSVRVALDGYKTSTTLHKKYLNSEEAS